jgi:hypothetical protein
MIVYVVMEIENCGGDGEYQRPVFVYEDEAMADIAQCRLTKAGRGKARYDIVDVEYIAADA